jgi:excisionase family DNA binding protein
MDTEVALPCLQRLAFSIAESAASSGLSRSSIYRLIAADKLQTVKRGRRRLVPKSELERMCGFEGDQMESNHR